MTCVSFSIQVRVYLTISVVWFYDHSRAGAGINGIW